MWCKYTKFRLNLGNSYLLKDFKIGVLVFNVEKFPGQGATLIRSAGMVAKIIQKILFSVSKMFVAIRIRSSGKIFYLNGNCHGILGQSSNPKHKKISLRKAGISRNLGYRPSVRGVAMNPIDHPHGGGEGKTSGGRVSVSPWGKLTKGYRTRAHYKKERQKKIIKRMRYGRSFK